jgi:hypothetical protein
LSSENHGSAVSALQRKLNRCFGAGLKVGNDFGSLTKTAPPARNQSWAPALRGGSLGVGRPGLAHAA